MMAFTSLLKGYKRKNAWEGGCSKLRVHRVKIYTASILRCVPALGLPGMYIKGKIKCFITNHHSQMLLGN